MSICPDKRVISEYFDGELPSPWKEKLEGHITECSDCAQSYKHYSTISTILNKDSDEKVQSFDYGASFERLKQKLNELPVHSSPVSSSEDAAMRECSFWQRSIKLPIPIVAAAVLALLFLPAFLFFAMKSSHMQQQGFAYQVLQAPSNNVRKSSSSQVNKVNFNSDIDGFIRLYMPNQQDQGVLITLPAHIFNLDTYTEYFQHIPVVETKQSTE